jgi:methyl-accepting chemotaxis protein
VGGIAQATASMGSIDGQVREIAGSGESLNADVEGASSAIFELDASGSELSAGAGVLSSNVDEVASSIDQMARSISQVHEGSEGLVAAADDVSSSMEETATTARQVDASAAEMSLLSTRVIELAESGHGQVQETIRGMDAIHEATDSARRVIEKLGDSTREIDSVIGVIDGVADETNLLALNAAIIAAQAGEHGRAFAVVAGQIKGLANRVLASTKEVAELVHAVQQESSDASGAIALGSKSVQRGVELAGEADEERRRQRALLPAHRHPRLPDPAPELHLRRLRGAADTRSLARLQPLRAVPSAELHLHTAHRRVLPLPQRAQVRRQRGDARQHGLHHLHRAELG